MSRNPAGRRVAPPDNVPFWPNDSLMSLYLNQQPWARRERRTVPPVPPDDLTARLAGSSVPARADQEAEYGAQVDAVEALVDLAKQGHRDDFRALALMKGIEEGEIEVFWRGTRQRLGLKE